MFKTSSAPADMTVGAPWKNIIKFTIPMLIGNIAQQLYSTVDSIVVGKYEGDNALAAVGSATPILNLLLVLFIGISAGTGVMVSQYFGAKNRRSLSHTIGNSITVAALSCIILIVVAAPLIDPLLTVLNTPVSIHDACAGYLMISLLGMVGMAYYNILSGVLRGNCRDPGSAESSGRFFRYRRERGGTREAARHKAPRSRPGNRDRGADRPNRR